MSQTFLFDINLHPSNEHSLQDSIKEELDLTCLLKNYEETVSSHTKSSKPRRTLNSKMDFWHIKTSGRYNNASILSPIRIRPFVSNFILHVSTKLQNHHFLWGKLQFNQLSKSPSPGPPSSTLISYGSAKKCETMHWGISKDTHRLCTFCPISSIKYYSLYCNAPPSINNFVKPDLFLQIFQSRLEAQAQKITKSQD